MAQETRTDQQINQEGQAKPGMGEKFKNTIFNIKERITGQGSQIDPGNGRAAESSPPARPPPVRDDKVQENIAHSAKTEPGSATTDQTPTASPPLHHKSGNVQENVPQQSSPETAAAATSARHHEGGNVQDNLHQQSSPRTAAASAGTNQNRPQVPQDVGHQDFGEKIMDKLTWRRANPYSTGNNPNAHPEAGSPNPYTSGSGLEPTNPTGTQHHNQSAHLEAGSPNPYTSASGLESTNPTGAHQQQRATEQQSTGCMGKFKNMVTGQKPAQGTATENATTGTTGTGATGDNFQHGYVQPPHPENADFYDRTKEKLGLSGQRTPDADRIKQKLGLGGQKTPHTADTKSEETRPSAANPDKRQTQGATFTDPQGHPIEGPTQPRSEDTKKEGLMTKLIDKLHLHETHSSPTAVNTNNTAT